MPSYIDGRTLRPEYDVWKSMIKRCHVPATMYFANYGGRGISVCDSWREDFANFFADMGPRPSRNHSIDRYPNNDGDYEPGNCRWATRGQQIANQRKPVKGATQVNGRWQSQIQLGGKSIYLGQYPTEEEAVSVYSAARRIIEASF